MTLEIEESAGSSDFPMPIDADSVPLNREAPLTIESLGIEIGEEAPFTEQDFEDALRKASRPIVEEPEPQPDEGK